MSQQAREHRENQRQVLDPIDELAGSIERPKDKYFNLKDDHTQTIEDQTDKCFNLIDAHTQT